MSRLLPITRTTYNEFISKQLSVGGTILSNGAYADGYDIVYVDYNNGADYIQRNARLLETVIKWVNDHKSGTQPNTMLAMSMGGLVAQYALREIENDVANAVAGAAPHQVRLLITHDSPHQGANVPLSVQLLVRQLAGTSFSMPFSRPTRLTDRYPALGQARDALLSPAAQQLLRYQTAPAGGFAGFAGLIVAAPTSLYDSFQQEYQALLGPTGVPQGTPGQPCRVVASANGSECGRPQPYGPYAMLATLAYEGNATNIGLLDVLNPYSVAGIGGVGVGLGLIAAPAGLVAIGVTSLFALGLTGAYDLTAALNLRALPDQQALPVCDVFLQVNKRTRLLGLFRVQLTLLEYHGYSLASQLPLDSGSGGIISLAAYAQQLGSATTSLPPGLLQQQQFCFTPTFSTLNITPANSAALTAQYSPGTNVGTPFANFRTAGRENEQHLDYTALNSTWMLRELRQTPQVLSCQAFCAASPTISGPAVICGSGATFSLNGLPANTQVAWSLSTGAAVSATQGTGPTFTVSFSGTGNGAAGTLMATLSSECGSVSIKIPVAVGPALQLTALATNECALRVQANTAGYDNLEWVVNGTPQGYFSGTDSFDAYDSNGRITVGVRGINRCTGVAKTVSVSGRRNQGCMAFAPGPAESDGPAAYPNPAADEVQIIQGSAAASSARQGIGSAAAPAAISSVRLYDTLGRLCLAQTGPAAPAMLLHVRELPIGFYIVHIVTSDGKISRQQLRIAR